MTPLLKRGCNSASSSSKWSQMLLITVICSFLTISLSQTTASSDSAKPALTYDDSPLIISKNQNNTNNTNNNGSSLVAPVVTEQIRMMNPHIIGDHDVQPQNVLELNNPNGVVVYDDNNNNGNNNNNNIQYDSNQYGSSSFAMCGRGVVCGDQLIPNTLYNNTKRVLPKLDHRAIKAEKNVTRHLRSLDRKLNDAQKVFKQDRNLSSLKNQVNQVIDRASNMERRIDKLMFINAARQSTLQVDNEDIQEKLQVDRKRADLEQQKGAAIIDYAQVKASEYPIGYTVADAKAKLAKINNQIKQLKQEKKLIDAETAERRQLITTDTANRAASNKTEFKNAQKEKVKELAKEDVQHIQAAVNRLDIELKATQQELKEGDIKDAKKDVKALLKAVDTTAQYVDNSKSDINDLYQINKKKGDKYEKIAEKADSKLQSIIQKARQLQNATAESSETNDDASFEPTSAGLAKNPKPLKPNKVLKKEIQKQLNNTAAIVEALEKRIADIEKDAQSGKNVRAAAEADGLERVFEGASQSAQKTIDDLNSARDLRTISESKYEKLMNRALKLHSKISKLVKIADKILKAGQKAINQQQNRSPSSAAATTITPTSSTTSSSPSPSLSSPNKKLVESVKTEVIAAEKKLASDVLVQEQKLQKKIMRQEKMIERDQEKLMKKENAIEEKLDQQHREIKKEMEKMEKKILYAVQNKVDAVVKQETKAATKEDQRLQEVDAHLSTLMTSVGKINQRQKQEITENKSRGNSSSVAKTILKEEIKAAAKEKKDMKAYEKDRKAERKAEKQEASLENRLNQTSAATERDASKLNKVENALNSLNKKLAQDNTKLEQVKIQLDNDLANRETAKQERDNQTASALKKQVKKEERKEKELTTIVNNEQQQVKELQNQATVLRNKVAVDVSKQQAAEQELDASKQLTNQLIDRVDDEKKHIQQDQARKEAAKEALQIIAK